MLTANLSIRTQALALSDDELRQALPLGVAAIRINPGLRAARELWQQYDAALRPDPFYQRLEADRQIAARIIFGPRRPKPMWRSA